MVCPPKSVVAIIQEKDDSKMANDKKSKQAHAQTQVSRKERPSQGGNALDDAVDQFLHDENKKSKKGRGGKTGSHEVWLRVSELLKLIPDHPNRKSTRELQQNLEDLGYDAEIRKVQRDLKNLVDLGYMINSVGDPKEPNSNFWFWKKGAEKPDEPKGLSGHQALAFYLMRHHLDRLMPVTTFEELAPYFDAAEKKLNAMETNPHLAGVLKWANKIRVVHPVQQTLPPKIDLEVNRVVYEALLKGRQVSIVYQKRDAEEPEEYTVNPLGLVQRGSVIILVSTRDGEDQPKNRLLHRISAAQLMNERAVRPGGFDLDRYIAEGKLGATAIGRGPINLVANFSDRAAKNLLESPLSEDQMVVPLTDGRVKITATVTATDQLVRWLLGYGADVEVLEPEALRNQIASAAAAMHKLYPAP